MKDSTRAFVFGAIVGAVAYHIMTQSKTNK